MFKKIIFVLEFFMCLFWAVLEAAELPYGLFETLTEIHGCMDLSYFDFDKDGDSEGKWTKSSFDSYEYYFGVLVDASATSSLFGEVRYEHGGDTIELRQGYVLLKKHKLANIKAGKFYVPIGSYSRIYYPTLKKFVSYAMPMRQIIVSPWSDVGVEINGETVLSEIGFNYSLAVVNGFNSLYASSKPRAARQNRDNNNAKTFVGRLGFVPIRELEVAVSYATGKYDDDDLYDCNIIDTDMELNLNKLEVRGEYVQSNTERASTEDLKREGYYIHVFYKLLQKLYSDKYLEVGMRYDTLDPDKSIDNNNDLTRISFAINFHESTHLLYKLEYQIIEEREDPQIDNNGFLAQLVMDF